MKQFRAWIGQACSSHRSRQEWLRPMVVSLPPSGRPTWMQRMQFHGWGSWALRIFTPPNRKRFIKETAHLISSEVFRAVACSSIVVLCVGSGTGKPWRSWEEADLETETWYNSLQFYNMCWEYRWNTLVWHPSLGLSCCIRSWLCVCCCFFKLLHWFLFQASL